MPFVHVEPNLAIGIKKHKTSKDQYAASRINKLFSTKSSKAAFTDLEPKQVMLVSTDTAPALQGTPACSLANTDCPMGYEDKSQHILRQQEPSKCRTRSRS